MEEHSFSIVIPTYKRHQRLQRAVESVKSQNHTNYEIIVVNDDPLDQEIHNLFGNGRNTNIKVVNNCRKKGGNGARNTGILESENEFVALLDDDDEWKENHLNELSKKISSGDIECIISSHEVESHNSWVKHEYQGKEFRLEDFVNQKVQIGASSTICFKKTGAQKIDLFDETLQRHQDLDFILRKLATGRVFTTEKSTVKIYGHNVVNYKKIKESKIKFLEKCKSYIADKKLYKKYKAYHYRNLMINAFISKEYKEGAKLLIKLPSLGVINPVRYIRAFLIIIDNLIGSKLDNTWTKLNKR